MPGSYYNVMAGMQWIASVGDLGLLSSLAASRRRLAIAAVASLLATIGYGLLVGDHVQNRSNSVGLNVGLISGQFFLVLLAAYVQAMFAGAMIFGDAWRRRVFLGERSERDEAEAIDEAEEIGIGALRDNSMHFYGIFALALVANYFAVVLVTGDYIDRYNRTGYSLTLFRSPAAEDRVRAIRGLVDPVHDDSARAADLRIAVAEAIADPEPEVAAWAAWAAGHLQLSEAQPALLSALESPRREVRVEAALALGRLNDPEAESRMIGLLSAVGDDPEFLQALVTGLGLMPSVDAVPALVALLGVSPPEVETPVLWAVGRARTTEVREAVVARWQAASDVATRCAVAEALKHATTVDDYEAMRDAFRDSPVGEGCEQVVRPERRYADDEAMAPVVYVIGEELRAKYLKAAFNIGGPGLEEWLVDVAWSEEESDGLKVLADRLAQELRRSPSRLPRE